MPTSQPASVFDRSQRVDIAGSSAGSAKAPICASICAATIARV